MSVTSNRTSTTSFTGDLTDSLSFSAAINTTSPGSVTIHSLSSGANTITLPTGGTVVRAATIIPPSSNTAILTVKGVTGDTGVIIHKTDPTTLTFDTTAAATFVLTASTACTGVRIVWS